MDAQDNNNKLVHFRPFLATEIIVHHKSLQLYQISGFVCDVTRE
jgi:hypothetical protein